MIARVLPVLLMLAAAPAPERDPFLAALAGRSGPDAVAAPDFDPDAEAASWTTRPRREIVDALAARLLRGEAKNWWEPAKEGAAGATLPAPPSRIPADFEAGKFEVSDRLAGRIPADAAAVFFASLEEAERSMDELSKFLPKALPVPFGDAPGGRRDALALAVGELLLPTIWRSNPAVRRGTRQAALLAASPDLRWAPEVALVVEVDDASLVRFHRLSTLSFEDRGRRRLRVDGLDATSDDGSVRSYFGLEGGIAVWSTGKAFRDRILAAAAGKAPTLLSPDPRAYALARATFPSAARGPLLVVPDAFLERANSTESRAGRASSLRCDAVRLILAARALSKAMEPAGVRLDCPSAGTITVSVGSPGARCSIHGSALQRVPMGDLAPRSGSMSRAKNDVVAAAAMPVAALWRDGWAEVLIPAGKPGAVLMGLVLPLSESGGDGLSEECVANRLSEIRARGISESDSVPAYAAILGELPESDCGRKLVWRSGRAGWEGATRFEYWSLPGDSLAVKEGEAVLRIGKPSPVGASYSGGGSRIKMDLPLEWR